MKEKKPNPFAKKQDKPGAFKPSGVLAALKKKLSGADSEEGEPVADDEGAPPEMKKRGR